MESSSASERNVLDTSHVSDVAQVKINMLFQMLICPPSSIASSDLLQNVGNEVRSSKGIKEIHNIKGHCAYALRHTEVQLHASRTSAWDRNVWSAWSCCHFSRASAIQIGVNKEFLVKLTNVYSPTAHTSSPTNLVPLVAIQVAEVHI